MVAGLRIRRDANRELNRLHAIGRAPKASRRKLDPPTRGKPIASRRPEGERPAARLGNILYVDCKALIAFAAQPDFDRADSDPARRAAKLEDRRRDTEIGPRRGRETKHPKREPPDTSGGSPHENDGAEAQLDAVNVNVPLT